MFCLSSSYRHLLLSLSLLLFKLSKLNWSIINVFETVLPSFTRWIVTISNNDENDNFSSEKKRWTTTTTITRTKTKRYKWLHSNISIEFFFPIKIFILFYFIFSKCTQCMIISNFQLFVFFWVWLIVNIQILIRWFFNWTGSFHIIIIILN